MHKNVLLDPNKNHSFAFMNEWTQLWEHNSAWYDFTLAEIKFENDIIMGGWEVNFIVFGLGFSWRYTHTETEHGKVIKDFIKELEEERKEKDVK